MAFRRLANKLKRKGLTMSKAIRGSTILPILLCGYAATVGAQSEFGRVNDAAAMATTAAGPKTPAIKTVTSFSSALRCGARQGSCRLGHAANC